MPARPLILGALFALTSASALAQTPPAPSSRVLLTWDDRSLDDEGYVRVVRAIAGDIPEASWPTEKVQPGEGLESLVDRLFDFYKTGTGRFVKPMPQTVDALIDLIAKANRVAPDKLAVGQTLRVPPVPPRAKTIEDGTTPERLFDPMTRESSVVDGRRLSLPASPSRNATTTRVALSADAAMAAGVGTVTAPKSDGLAQVRLMQNPACPPPTNVLAASPYLASARQRLRDQAARVRQLAASRKLVLIDFDFADSHGGKVKSAADWLLDQMGVPELSAFIDTFDLGGVELDKPVPQHLRLALKQYQDRGGPFGTGAEAAAAAQWLAFGASPTSTELRNVPAQMLQAALSSRLLTNPAVVSLSWGIISAGKALPFDVSGLLANGSVVFVAAGNEREPLNADFEPQNAASTRREFTNVTYGSPTGEIFGKSHNPDVGRVEVSALGCGYSFGRLTVGDAGSSFATPVVAAAAWLKFLLDRTSGATMRPLIARASSLLPLRAQTVMAGGVFDPARLIANPGPHYVDRANQVVPLTDVVVSSMECGRRTTRTERPGSQQIVVYQDGPRRVLLRRFENLQTGTVSLDDPCPVNDLGITAKANGQPWAIRSVDEFLGSVAYIAF